MNSSDNQNLEPLQKQVLTLARQGATSARIANNLGVPEGVIRGAIAWLVRHGYILGTASSPCKSGKCASQTGNDANGRRHLPIVCAGCPISRINK